jgi:membrane protease YdiL (CAAX protease family)
LQSNPSQPATLRSFNLALFVAGCLWIVAASSAASHASQGIATRLNLPLAAGPLEQAFFLFLLVCGFATIRWMSTRTDGGFRSTNALPSRTTASREWLRGAALGWGMLLIAVLPMMLARVLYPQLWLAPGAWGLALLSLLTLALYTLALEIAFRGFLFARLIAAIGPVAATIVISLIYALASRSRPYSTTLSVAIAFFAGVLYSMAYLRTHALWLGWGMHFAWDASMAVLLGLPIAGYGTYSSVVETATGGSDWLTGGPYGPEGALFTLIVLLGAMIVLYRISRDYAWNYTHPPIIPAGYAVVIAPPAAHTAMEAAAAPAPLVQILSSTPTASSTLPVIDEHLRGESNLPPTD